jgi:plasmid maintenance system antidote protein VapI
LAAYFRTTPEFWLNLQSKFELETARRNRNVARQLDRIQSSATWPKAGLQMQLGVARQKPGSA